jgi:hypothetical protein
LLDELRLIAACQLAMAGLAYLVARRLTSRVNAWLIAFASLVMLMRGPKECAYDYTAELVAWASLALGAVALTTERDKIRTWSWLGAGAGATFTFAFKQSTATGAMLGWLGAFAYLGMIELVVKRSLRRLLRPLALWCAGGALGLVGLAAMLGTFGSSLGAFYQAVLADGPSLKGGSLSLGANLVRYLIGLPAYPASLVLTALAAAVIVRLGRRSGAWAAAPAPVRLSLRDALAVALPALLAFGIAISLVVRPTTALPDAVLYWCDQLRHVPAFGLMFACFSVVARAWPLSGSDAFDRSHVRTAMLTVALGVSLLHNLSSPELRPFYDPNPLIVLAFTYLFDAFDGAELPRLKIGVYALAMAALFSPKLDRMLSARIPAGREGYWGGMYVNESALPIAQAAARARELAGADGKVLVLPEDLELRALIGRPRPELRGAVLFVDQYAARLVDHDLGVLERNLPEVVVIRPAERDEWLRLFALWSSTSGTRRVIERFLDDFLPKHYRKDSTFPTRFDVKSVNLEIWVRNE